ncbi:MAG: preprotein translocase subunit SecA [Patescibacteria group bacterium]
MSFLDRFFKDPAAKTKKLLPIVERINALEENIHALSDTALLEKSVEFKKRLASGEMLDDLLPEAFAVVREAAQRTLSQRHFDVQLIGGMILHERGIAEMKTGEGKTLVATLPAYLNALTGRGVHVVTVNDYLSRRDATWMGQVYNALGLTVGVLNHDTSYLYDPAHTEKDTERDLEGSFRVVHEFLRPATKKEAYAADITYGTNNEFGFDYLRDNISYRQEDLAQRPFYYAIVDEIDSILIDEARTPLIISAPAEESGELYQICTRIAAGLIKDTDYTVDEKLRAIQLTDSGIEKAQKAFGIDNIYTEGGVKYVHHLETAVRAKALFERDKDYVVKDGQVIIVDEFTGRMQPGRRWSEGLHQAMEAKEGMPIQRESRTVASVTFQNYFRLYEKLSGMTGTALTSSEEFYKVYGLEVISVPTNRPIARIDQNDLIFQTEQGKFKAIARHVKMLHEKGQPVLIGTVSIEKNEVLSAYLKQAGIPHEMLNAKNHEREGEIIAQGGKRGGVTVATNMAGRGVDIKLGGALATAEEHEEVKTLGGLFVLGTERHEARRIDNQLRGRSGRQGDPGETQFFVSLEDPLMRVFASDAVKSMMGKFGIPEDEAIENRFITKALETAQTKIEGFHFDARKHVLEFDDVLNQQRKSVYGRRNKLLLGEHAFLEELWGSARDLLEEKEIEQADKKKAEIGDATFWEALRRIALQTIDMLWMEHLETMDHLRQSVNLRAYGQRDPLVEYKREGLRLFRELEGGFLAQIAHAVPNISMVQMPQAPKKITESREGETEAQKSTGTVMSSGPKVGRNDPCPCGSGKKYKRCHMTQE